MGLHIKHLDEIYLRYQSYVPNGLLIISFTIASEMTRYFMFYMWITDQIF